MISEPETGSTKVKQLREEETWLLRKQSSFSLEWSKIIGDYLSNYFSFCRQFLGAFAKLRKATISFVMSVRKKQLGCHWTDFHKI